MSTRPSSPHDLKEATVAVVLLADRAGSDALARCLRALLPQLPDDVALLAAGPTEARRGVEELIGAQDVAWLDGAGAEAWNAAAARVPAADLVLLSAESEVGAGWLTELRAAAKAVPDAATVTALSNDAAFLSVPRRNLSWPLLPPALTIDDAAARVRAGALRIHPRTPTALPHCALITRAALQLVGQLDAALAPREALADFCARATAAGLVHVVADAVLVAHRGEAADVPAGGWTGAAATRHPWLAGAVAEAAEDRYSALARALLTVSVSLEPVGVTVDARSLGGGVTGTTVHVVELLGALTAREDVSVRALLPSRIGDVAGRALEGMPRLARLTEEQALGGAPRTHLVHRPWQIESAQDMGFLDTLGERTILTNQDLIGYRTPSVFPSDAAWRDYRQATRAALGMAAMVLFFSPEAAADAAADDLVAPERRRVVPLGAEAQHPPAGADPQAPARLAGVERPFLLQIGNRFRHKNVRFALALLAALRDDQGWDGDLVLAGAEVMHGSGSGDDAAWLLRHPEHAAHVIELGAVAEAEKAWLLREAAAVLYPSTYEGFGLIPFEAAAAGTPCLVAHVSALRDTLPVELALLTPWDASASARDVVGLLRDPGAAAALAADLNEAGSRLTWAATAEALVDAYRVALAMPAPPAARLAADLARAEHDYWSVRDGLAEAAWTLVRPDAPLVDERLASDLADVLRGPGGRTRLLRALKLVRRLPARA